MEPEDTGYIKWGPTNADKYENDRIESRKKMNWIINTDKDEGHQRTCIYFGGGYTDCP